MEKPTSYLDLLPPEIGARVDRLLKDNRVFALFPKLDPEIQMYVALQLRYPDLMRLCVTSTATKKICDDDFFWKLKTQRDFGVDELSEESWKKEYQFHLEQAGLQLIEASKSGNIKIMKELLEFGVNPNIQDKYGWTVLMAASYHGHTEIIKLLLKYGADPNIQSKSGSTALIFASRYGRTKIVKLLLENGAHPNLQDKRGTTVLLLASTHGYTKIVELLLKYKANLNLQNNDGDTALILASWGGHTKIVRLLKEYGAK